jgi:hypothetical protein
VAKDVRRVSSDVPVYYTLLSGTVGGLIVFVLTVGSGWVVRTRQRGRELSGLARVIRPEMERNAEALMILRKLKEHSALSPDAYQREHPIYNAWLDTRTKLAELMQPGDFRVLSYFYEELELLDHTASRGGSSMEDAQKVDIRLAACEESSLPAMSIVDGYCEARWKPLAGWSPGPIE